MTEQQVTEKPAQVRPLEYATPVAAERRRPLWVGVLGSLCLGIGSLCGLLGLLLAAGVRDDPAVFIAFGTGFTVFGGLLMWIFWTRK